MPTLIRSSGARPRVLLAFAVHSALALGWHAVAAAPPPVTNCNSSGAGSLSAAIADPLTVDGSVIDLSALKHVCSTITVDSLAVHQNDLVIEGAGAKYMTLDAAGAARVINHDGTGTLALSGITIANGSFTSATQPKGGCVYSTGNVSLIDVDARDCHVNATSANESARGGAIYTEGNLHLLRSTISESNAHGTAGVPALGGGAYVKGDFSALYSTVRNNTAVTANGSAYAIGGGVVASAGVDIENSTISSNAADLVGGLKAQGGAQHAATIVNSTISGNQGTIGFGGLWNNTVLSIANSTIAFNHSRVGVGAKGAGVYSLGSFALDSTIISGNGGADGPNDIAGGGSATVSGSDNLVFKTALPLPMGSNNTTDVCAKLDVLTDNGGLTLTQNLKDQSPALDNGAAPMSLALDQRLKPRLAGPQTDIGAVERAQDDKIEGILVSGFDGFCDH